MSFPEKDEGQKEKLGKKNKKGEKEIRECNIVQERIKN